MRQVRVASTTPVLRGGHHQGREETVVGGIVLRVPLDPDGEIAALHLNGFYGAIVRKPDCLKMLTQTRHGLVVMAVALGGGTKNGRQSTGPVDIYAVRAHLPKVNAVLVVTNDIWKVLVQGAPEGNVDHLHAPAHRQKGHIG